MLIFAEFVKDTAKSYPGIEDVITNNEETQDLAIGALFSSIGKIIDICVAQQKEIELLKSQINEK